MTITKPIKPIRNHIQPSDIKRWAKHWNVVPEQINRAIDKVGNSAAAVEKRLTTEERITSSEGPTSAREEVDVARAAGPRS
jgi:hypothetical protein